MSNTAKSIESLNTTEILKNLNDNTKKCRFNLESISNLEVFKQNPRLFIRLKLSIDDNNYYETHQAYKTLHFRCINTNQFNESLELIFNGICFFMENNQNHCGVDLAKTFVETLKKCSFKLLTRQLIDKISYIHELLKNCAEERNEFVVSVLKWSSIFNNSTIGFGHPDINREFAITLWKEKNYSQSRYHFIRSFDGELLAHMIVEYHISQGFPSEVDIFLTQIILQLLSLKNKETARTLFKHYIEIHPNIKKKDLPYDWPLMNFSWFLILACDEGKAVVFNELCNNYKKFLIIDQTYNDYLDKIGQNYFNLKSKKREQSNPFNNILRMLMSSDNNNQDKDEEFHSPEATSDSEVIHYMDDNLD